MLCVIAYVLDIGVCVLILYLNQCRKVKDKKWAAVHVWSFGKFEFQISLTKKAS